MKIYRPLLSIFLTIITALSIIVGQNVTIAAQQASVRDIAHITTVLIAEGLERESVDNNAVDWNAGSGVIIGKRGNTYYVLTAFHVIPLSQRTYGVRTHDGEIYCLKDAKTCRVRYLGQRRSDQTIEGFDLAIVEFESNKDYPVATLGHSEELEQNRDTLMVSGWPRPGSTSSIREWKTINGQLTFKSLQADADGGYSLFYDNQTTVGMSGGPVFNQQGEVVGIHGRGSNQENVYCVDPQLSADHPQLNVDDSCGMQMIHFISTSEGRAIKSAFNLDPLDPQVVAQALGDTGPTIVDLREAFTYESMIRDQPSMGCDFHTIGCEGL